MLFLRIFISTLFILINIRFLGFDIIPSFFGYILMLYSFNQLKTKNSYFNSCRLLCIPLIILSIFNFYNLHTNKIINVSYTTILSVTIEILTFILNLSLFINLFNGIKNIAEKNKLIYLEKLCCKTSKFYKIFTSITVILNIFYIAISNNPLQSLDNNLAILLNMVLLLTCSLTYVLNYIAILNLLWKSYKILDKAQQYIKT